jgi:hypothetical protein
LPDLYGIAAPVVGGAVVVYPETLDHLEDTIGGHRRGSVRSPHRLVDASATVDVEADSREERRADYHARGKQHPITCGGAAEFRICTSGAR